MGDNNIDDLSQKVLGKESLDQQACDEQMEIRRKIVFMLSTVKELMMDGWISDFSILESSLEQVFKNVVIKQARRKESEGSAKSIASE